MSIFYNALHIRIRNLTGTAVINGVEYTVNGDKKKITEALKRHWVIDNNRHAFKPDGSIRGIVDLNTIKQPKVIYE